MERRRLVLLLVAVLAAALGVAAVFVYARGAETRAAEEYGTVRLLVATEEIAPGEPIEESLANGRVDLLPVPEGQELDGATDSTDDLGGDYARVRIYPGEQLIAQKFGGKDEVEADSDLIIPAGKLAQSVSVEGAARVGDFIRPGADVAVFLTQDGSSSKVLLERVQVLAVGGETATPGSGGDQGGETSLLTVALTQREIERVLFAQSIGSLSVALLNDQSKVRADEGVDGSNVFE
ncbi:Flp pilus assembly protein CpaB [Nocardioides sambongensis]|uniref:Flp pilus assembly protein CpaB n=1 Tax=Nocardioides sambongensis TaxID=2589074 RepID=UPI00112DADD4|nr:Flp pilus assembly protein CpaB [Nocardioides sambongensis]